jgi:NADH:ubiquinone oxidoreductase subunit 3 (subunit A)
MPDFYFDRYLPLLIHILVAGVIACAMVTLSYFIGQHKYNPAKMSPYECGMEPVGNARQRFTVKFYLVGMLFILFDVEAVFLYPWAIVQRSLKEVRLWHVLVLGDAGVHRHPACRLLVRLEKGRASTGTSRVRRRKSSHGTPAGHH